MDELGHFGVAHRPVDSREHVVDPVQLEHESIEDHDNPQDARGGPSELRSHDSAADEHEHDGYQERVQAKHVDSLSLGNSNGCHLYPV